MTESNPWEKPPRIKMATEVDAEIYQMVKDVFHHGQMAKFLQTIIYSTAILVKEKRMLDIYQYISLEKELTLPIKERD